MANAIRVWFSLRQTTMAAGVMLAMGTLPAIGSVSPDSAPLNVMESTLYSYKGYPTGGKDGIGPSGIALAKGGNLYGVSERTNAAAQTASIGNRASGSALYYTTDASIPMSDSTEYRSASAITASENLNDVAVPTDQTERAAAADLAWIPFILTPTANTSGGQSGLIIMPTNNLAASPAPTYIATQPVQSLGVAEQFAAGAYKGALAGGVLAVAPNATIQLFFYATTGSDGNVHVYGLNLSNAREVPVPTQLSNLSLPALTSICGGRVIQTKLNSAKSAALLIKIAGSNGCTSGYVYKYIHNSDSATTAPLAVSLPSDTFFVTPMYNYNGILSGLLTESITNTKTFKANLYFYDGDTFKNPKLLLKDTPAFITSTAVVSKSATAGSSYVDIIFTGSSESNESTLYAVSAQGTLSTLATIAGVTGAALFSQYIVIFDDDNLYFTISSGNTSSVYQLPLTLTGEPELLFSGTDVGNLLGANDTDVVLGQSGNVYSLPVGKTSTAPKTIAENVGQGVSVVAASPRSAAEARVFISELSYDSLNETYINSSLVMTPSGTVRQTLEENTTYDDAGGNYTGVPPTFGLLPGTMIQVSGITDSIDFGGGYFNIVKVSTLSGTALTTPAGAVFTIPTGQGYVAPFYAFTPTVAAGSLRVLVPSLPPVSEIGLVADLSKYLIVPISVENTDVSAAF